jgi:hypothetical protein
MGFKQCGIIDCTNKYLAKGYCSKHYTRNLRYGDPLAMRDDGTPRTCTFGDCREPHYGNGLCSVHWQRKARNGDPGIRIRIRNSDEERFWSKTEKRGPDECWPWLGNLNRRGYGFFRLGPTHIQAHRYAYQLLVAAIPKGLTIDHLCCNIICVNPAHMEVVTRAENSRRRWVREKAAIQSAVAS